MTTRTPRIAGVLLACAALLAPTAPADATPSDPPVTTVGATTLTVSGDGWGHGHGMSQWGAQGAALQGLTHRQILAFYYPGTHMSSLSARVRVLITADTDNNTTVRAAAGLRVADLGTGRSYSLPMSTNAKLWRLKNFSGKTRVHFYRNGGWHLYRTGGRVALRGGGEFRSSTGILSLRLPSGVHRYRGTLRFVSTDTVNVLTLENYLKGVIPAEAFPSWEPGALRAQAVAARTYAAFERADHVGGYYQICDTTSCQVYKGYDIETATTNAAVTATVGQVLLYSGKLAFTQFSASSGGWTSTGSQPYLIAQPDIYDTAASGDTNLEWTKTVKIEALENAYPQIGTLTKIQIMDRDGTTTDPNHGWVTSIQLTGTGGNKTIDGATFKSLYGLKSAYFSLSAP